MTSIDYTKVTIKEKELYTPPLDEVASGEFHCCFCENVCLSRHRKI